MGMRRNWTIRVEQRRAEVTPRPLTEAMIAQQNLRDISPDLGRDALVIDMYDWADKKGRSQHLADRRTYIGLTHMNLASHGLAGGQQEPLPKALRRAS